MDKINVNIVFKNGKEKDFYINDNPDLVQDYIDSLEFALMNNMSGTLEALNADDKLVTIINIQTIATIKFKDVTQGNNCVILESRKLSIERRELY